MNFDDFDTQIQSDELEENFMEFNESMPCAPAKEALYYDAPTQVKFFDFEGEGPYWIGGIAYHDVIICGCCGATIEISELYDMAEENGLGEDPIKVLNWNDIQSEIKGESIY